MAVVNNLPSQIQTLLQGPRLADVAALATTISNGGGMLSNNAITASTTQSQAGGTILSYGINRITVANSSDAVTLPKAAAGSSIVIINVTGQTVQVFPFKGDKINAAAVDAAVTIADATTSDYYCAVGLIWNGGATTNEA